MAAGDYNDDGKTDLAAGAYRHSSSAGRVYIFYNDGAYPSSPSSADVTIAGEGSNNWFGYSLAAGDYNTDSKTDLAVGSMYYGSYTGRAYIFYNDAGYPANATSANVIITGEATSSNFGAYLASGDFDANGRTDLAVSAYGYNDGVGRLHIFYNDGTYSGSASSSDVIVTGDSATAFGGSIIAGDFNSDGSPELVARSAGDFKVYFITMKHLNPIQLPLQDVTIKGMINIKGSFGVR